MEPRLRTIRTIRLWQHCYDAGQVPTPCGGRQERYPPRTTPVLPCRFRIGIGVPTANQDLTAAGRLVLITGTPDVVLDDLPQVKTLRDAVHGY